MKAILGVALLAITMVMNPTAIVKRNFWRWWTNAHGKYKWGSNAKDGKMLLPPHHAIRKERFICLRVLF